jgi:hypothetical protein
MIKKLTALIALPSLLMLGSCATSNQTAQQIDQNDDVYYSVAQAKEEVEVIAQAKPEPKAKSDYVTDDELYRDGYGDNYSGSYAERIYRFRNYAPWRGYYNSPYSYGSLYRYDYYDPFYNPYSFYGGPGINLAVGINGGYFNYNPWRYYGYNYYGSNFWGPYSYYNSNPYGIGYGGGYYGGGYYGGGYGVNRPVYTSPNYRPRPGRSSDALPIDRGAVNGGAPGGIIRNGNGNVIQSGGRAERYNGGNSTTPSTTGSSPQNTAPRPARVSQSRPERTVQPERIYSTPSNNNTGGNNTGGGRSSDSGSSSGGGGRPSRAN